MKKLLSLFALICFVSLSLNAQNKNAVKLGLGGFLYGNGFLKYERLIVNKQSVEVNFGIGLINNFDRAATTIQDEDEDITSVDLKSNRMFLNLQYRFYFGQKEGMQGFYIAPYFSWNRFAFDMDLTNNKNVVYTSSDLQYRSLNGGLQLGVQWLVANERLAIDWYFFGFGAGSGKISGSYTSSDPNENFAATANDISTELDDIGFFQDRYEVNYTNNRLTASLKFPVPAFRTGLSLGFAF